MTIPICAVTGRIAGDADACGDCDPCGAAHMVPDAIKGVLTEKEEWRQKYGTSAAEIERLRQALETAPRPSSEKAWLIPYIDWFFKTRIAALRGDEQTADRIDGERS